MSAFLSGVPLKGMQATHYQSTGAATVNATLDPTDPNGFWFSDNGGLR